MTIFRSAVDYVEKNINARIVGESLIQSATHTPEHTESFSRDAIAIAGCSIQRSVKMKRVRASLASPCVCHVCLDRRETQFLFSFFVSFFFFSFFFLSVSIRFVSPSYRFCSELVD